MTAPCLTTSGRRGNLGLNFLLLPRAGAVNGFRVGLDLQRRAGCHSERVQRSDVHAPVDGESALERRCDFTPRPTSRVPSFLFHAPPAPSTHAGHAARRRTRAVAGQLRAAHGVRRLPCRLERRAPCCRVERCAPRVGDAPAGHRRRLPAQGHGGPPRAASVPAAHGALGAPQQHIRQRIESTETEGRG